KLQMLNSDLASQLKLAKNQLKGKSKGKADDHDPLLNKDLILKLAKQYTIMVYPWASKDLFLTTPSEDSPEPESLDHFKTLQTFNAGLVKELHRYLKDPELCKKAVGYAPFKKAFISQSKQGRSASVHTIRKCLPIIFDSINAPSGIWLTNNGTSRGRSPILKGLLQFPNTLATKEPLSPIFYPNCIKNATLLFMNDFQPKVNHLLTLSSPH
ncbi:hypothetical protein BT96DRAFT_809877, partial [Gymnopus androsaceus JB14]